MLALAVALLVAQASSVVNAAVNWNGFNWAHGCDFAGHDMSNVIIASELCGGKCAATPGCTHFTWSRYNGGTCWMKQGGAIKNDAFSTNDQTMVCGVMDTINWNGNNWAHGCDFYGQDMGNEVISSELCGGKCAATSGCTHFTWSRYNGGTCWMKKGGATKSNAFSTNDQTMVCGVMENSPSPVGTAGKTTRYWDCCKPSCSWPGKVPGNNKFARACNRDGYGTATDPNGASGCGGGPVFACNNHQPWAVNDQLAYGFAAATIPGLDERGRCCACYKLDFTSGPVQGKSMIVQVTNSGGDVNPNQFDLQIPGGGVGIFNGCSAQWPGVGPDGWGNRYGGVSSRNECFALPDQIRQGCFWRFDWFRGADNPSMVYSKVRCPDELVAASNCRRDDE